MSRKMLMMFMLITVMILSFSCDHDRPAKTEVTGPVESGGQGTIRFNVSFKSSGKGAGKIAATEEINTVTAYVYNNSGTELLQEDLTISDNRASGTLTVTALNDLRVVLAYFDGPIVQYIGQDDDVDVPFGGETTADIVAQYMGMSVSAPDTAFVGEKYTVSWDENPYAVRYELQESSTQIYSDVNTYRIIEPKTEESTYHYRVRVVTPFGNGPWYLEGGATTGVYIREGELDIDVPVPSDDINDIIFASIPGGNFQMGAEDRVEDQAPVHTVTVSGFEMSATEITNSQYCAFLNSALAAGEISVSQGKVVGASGSYSGQEYLRLTGEYNTNVKCWIVYADDMFSVTAGKEYQPVIYVSWYGAKAFAEYYELDLPTEAEWEYAGRGGKQYDYGTVDGTISTNNANYYSRRYPYDVGSFAPNPFGLYDMSGNVWEWCNDWYSEDYYASSPLTNPAGPASGTYRINRGCSWYSRETSEYYITYRKTDLPIAVDPFIGFRVVRR